MYRLYNNRNYIILYSIWWVIYTILVIINLVSRTDVSFYICGRIKLKRVAVIFSYCLVYSLQSIVLFVTHVSILIEIEILSTKNYKIWIKAYYWYSVQCIIIVNNAIYEKTISFNISNYYFIIIVEKIKHLCINYPCDGVRIKTRTKSLQLCIIVFWTK